MVQFTILEYALFGGYRHGFEDMDSSFLGVTGVIFKKKRATV